MRTHVDRPVAPVPSSSDTNSIWPFSMLWRGCSQTSIEPNRVVLIVSCRCCELIPFVAIRLDWIGSDWIGLDWIGLDSALFVAAARVLYLLSNLLIGRHLLLVWID